MKDVFNRRGSMAVCMTLLLTAAAPKHSLAASGPLQQFVISEFMAANENGIRDEDGDRSDWIEIANIGTAQGDLGGYFLTDTPGNLTKWRIPEYLLLPNHYVLIWASGKDRKNPSSPLHTNFKIAKAGGYLALLDPQTNVVSVFDSYPAQHANISYGLDPADPSFQGFFTNPTPGAQNSTAGSKVLDSPIFSIDTGIYTNATLTLTLSAAMGEIRYTTDGTIPAFNSPLYSGPITFGTNVTIKARAFLVGADFFPSEVVAKNYLFLDESMAGFNSNLPLLIISTEGRSILDNIPSGAVRAKGSLTVIDVDRGNSTLRSAPKIQALAAFELFGQNDVYFPKKPYRIEIQDALGNDLKIPMLGMPAEADWELRNSYNDKTLLNDFLGTEIFEKMGHYSLRRRLVELFVNTEGGRLNYASNYSGVMTLFEKIEQGKDRVDIAKLGSGAVSEPEISGGYMFKKDKNSAGDLFFSTTNRNGFSGQTFILHEPKPNEIRSAPVNGPLTANGSNQLAWLTKYLNTMESALYASNWLTATGTNHYSYYLDADSFADLHILVEFTKQIDGYRLSTFFQKDRGGKVKAGPVWDWDHSFGDVNFLDGGHTNDWYYPSLGERDHTWLRRLVTGTTMPDTREGDPDFVQLIADKWSVYRTNLLNGPRLIAEIDRLSLMLSNAAARNFTQYPILGQYVWPQPQVPEINGGDGGRPWDVDYVHPTNYVGASNSIIANMKKFVLGRYLWMDGQFTPPPAILATSGKVTHGSTVTLRAIPGETIFYTTDGTDPRGKGGVTNGTLYTGPITITGNTRLVARARTINSWQDTWSGPSAVTLFESIPALRISEIMYHPPAPPVGSPYVRDDFEFVEVKNTGGATLNLNRFTLTGLINFGFPDETLGPGESGVIVRNAAAFQSRYGAAIRILGEFADQLQTGGNLRLLGAAQEEIQDISFSSQWYPATDGLGFSLVPADTTAPVSVGNPASNWRASSSSGGSPGSDDGPPPLRPRILVNEALSHSEPPLVDAIELYNPTADSVNISGWFLSDDFQNPKKYVISGNTVIARFGFQVFYEDTSFNSDSSPTRFALGAEGDSVWLFSGDGANLTGHAHGFKFSASPNGVTFGRYIISTGEEQFVLQKQSTLGETNAGPLVGPMVISEIHYHPSAVGINGLPYNNSADQYLEFQNVTAASVALFDSGAPTNTWRLKGSIAFNFPNTNTVVAPGDYVLVVGFDPARDPEATAAFRTRNAVPASVVLFGPWNGSLNQEGGEVRLERPDTAAPDGSVPYITVDRVSYSSNAPWPSGANGAGFSLQRVELTRFGNDPANWVALTPNPGATASPSGIAPKITSTPSSRVVPTSRPLLLSAAATGTAPLHYQWQLNGLNVTDATNSILSISNFQYSMAGDWRVVVYNSAGSAVSPEFTLDARTGLRVIRQPFETFIGNGGSTNFSLIAEGTGPLLYQWKFNGASVTAANVSGVESSTLSIASVGITNDGIYTCVVSDDFDSIETDPAPLRVIFRPTFQINPLSQTAVEGGSVTFSVALSGSAPMTFRWRRGSTNIVSGIILSNATTTYSVLTLTNLHLSDSGTNYNCVVSNRLGFALGGSQVGVSSNAVLTVLADSDHDGIPDILEPLNGAADNDGDGMSNAAEYFAGTGFNDSNSVLKLGISGTEGATLTFLAVSNRTYTLQYTDSVQPVNWKKLADILAKGTNHFESVADPAPPPRRIYRLVTPIQP